MYVYDTKYHNIIWLKKLPDTNTSPLVTQTSAVSEKKEIKEIKSILKTSSTKTVKVEVPTNIKPIQRYIVISDDKLLKIARYNLHDIKKFISKNKLKDSFLHFSMNKIEKLNPVFADASWTNTKKSLYYNPIGLWVSHGSSWIDFVETNINQAGTSNLFGYTYKIEVYDSVKLINSKDEFFKFIKTYKKKPNDIKIYDVIDWSKVKKDYDGLIITPWLGDKIWHLNPNDRMEIIGGETAHEFFVDIMGARWKNNMILLSEWYRHWECASGVIWNINGIASCDLIKQTDFSKYI